MVDCFFLFFFKVVVTMALNSLSKTTFMAGPDDALVAADAYGSDTVVTSYTDTTKYGLDIPASPVGLKIKPPPIPGTTIVNPSQSGLGLKVPSLPQSEILDRVISSDVSIKNCFTNMSDAAKSLLKIPGDLLSKVESTINGVISGIKNLGNLDPSSIFKKLGDLKAIGCTTKSLTGGLYDLSIVDKGGLSGLISGVTNQGSSLGVTNIFSSISNVVKDKDILLSACKNIIPSASKDIYLLKDLSNTSIAGNIKSIMPNISGNTINNFRIGSGTKNFELPNLFNNISTTLDKVDGSWNNCIRNGETLLSGALCTSPNSLDFHKVLESKVMTEYQNIDTPIVGSPFILPNYDKPEMFLMLSKDLGEQSVEQCLKNDFPSLPIKVNEVTTNYSLTDKVQYSLNSTDTSFESYSDNSVIETIKIDNNSSQINVKHFDEEGILII